MARLRRSRRCRRAAEGPRRSPREWPRPSARSGRRPGQSRSADCCAGRRPRETVASSSLRTSGCESSPASSAHRCRTRGAGRTDRRRDIHRSCGTGSRGTRDPPSRMSDAVPSPETRAVLLAVPAGIADRHHMLAAPEQLIGWHAAPPPRRRSGRTPCRWSCRHRRCTLAQDVARHHLAGRVDVPRGLTTAHQHLRALIDLESEVRERDPGRSGYPQNGGESMRCAQCVFSGVRPFGSAIVEDGVIERSGAHRRVERSDGRLETRRAADPAGRQAREWSSPRSVETPTA